MTPPETLTISELSARSGVPVPTIKFYLREQLLPAGDLSSEKRGYYRADHVRRLQIIRALRDTAGLSIAVIRSVLHTLDRPSADAVDVIGPAVDALVQPAEKRPGAALRKAQAEIDEWLEREGVTVRPHAGAKRALARALVSLRAVEPSLTADAFTPYLKSMRAVAEHEIEQAMKRDLYRDNADALEVAVLATVLWEPVIVGLRRLLHEHMTTEIVRRPRRKR